MGSYSSKHYDMAEIEQLVEQLIKDNKVCNILFYFNL